MIDNKNQIQLVENAWLRRFFSIVSRGSARVGRSPLSSNEQRRLFAFERLTVGALIHHRVALVGDHRDAVEGAVIDISAMVSALGDRASDAGIGFAFIHVFRLLSMGIPCYLFRSCPQYEFDLIPAAETAAGQTAHP